MTKRLEEKHLALKKKRPNNENCQLTNNSHSCIVVYGQINSAAKNSTRSDHFREMEFTL